jgi:diacylglycerol kinase (ATP)
MRTLVILNPVAGGGVDDTRFRRRIAARLGADVAVSAAPGEAVRLAERAADSGYDRVVAAGGDGTVSEVAAGLALSGQKVVMGLLPIGTGNDLARSLGVPLHLDRAIEVVRAGRIKAIDTLRARAAAADDVPRELTNAAVGGFCGRISDRLNDRLRRRWKNLSYLRAALAELAELQRFRARLTVDGSETIETDAYMIVVANGRYAGGRIPLAPRALPDDGLLDLMLVRAVSAVGLAAVVPSVLRGRHDGSGAVVYRQARDLHIESMPPMWFNLDGETWRQSPASFEVQPAALNVITP